MRGRIKRAAGEVVRFGWSGLAELGAIGPDSRAGRRFGRFGQGSVICFPPNALFNERYIHIGAGTMIGPGVTLSAGMVPGHHMTHGSRMPPSQVLPLPSRRWPAEPPWVLNTRCQGPLSLVKMTQVRFSIPAALTAFKVTVRRRCTMFTWL